MSITIVIELVLKGFIYLLFIIYFCFISFRPLKINSLFRVTQCPENRVGRSVIIFFIFLIILILPYLEYSTTSCTCISLSIVTSLLTTCRRKHIELCQTIMLNEQEQ